MKNGSNGDGEQPLVISEMERRLFLLEAQFAATEAAIVSLALHEGVTELDGDWLHDCVRRKTVEMLKLRISILSETDPAKARELERIFESYGKPRPDH
jgi:hypothetical protein